MRALSLALSLLLAGQPCLAALRAAKPVFSVPSVRVVSPASLPVLPAAVVVPALPPALSVPSLPRAAVALPTPQAVQAAQAAVPAKLAEISKAVGADVARFGCVSSESAYGAAGGHVRILQGGLPAASAGDGVAVPPGGGSAGPPPLSPSSKKAVRRMIAGTMAFKFGMEAMTTSVPFVAMKALGGATPVALLVVAVYGTAQALGSSWIGSLTKRLPAARVLAGANVVQAALVAATLALAAAGMLAPWALYPLYGAIGLTVGAAETARRLVPPLLLGQDENALRTYNGRLHRWYEVAGVSGAALTGLLIWKLGALAAMIVTPPAALLAAWLFWRVKHPAAAPSPASGGGLRELGRAAKLIARDPRLLAAAAAMILPQVVHRLYEGLILPMYAKQVLPHEALSAALLTASNLGELIGATILLRYSAKFTGPYRWVRWGAYGLVAAWLIWLVPTLGLGAAATLAALLPVILVFSSTWAGSHLSLETELQKRVDPSIQPRVMGLLYASFVVIAALSSLVVGRLFDAFGLMTGLAVLAGVLTALGVALVAASRKLR